MDIRKSMKLKEEERKTRRLESVIEDIELEI